MEDREQISGKPGRWRIRYADDSGRKTERTIRNISVLGVAVAAFCEFRNAERTFLIDGIIEAIDLETGEIIENVWRHLGLTDPADLPQNQPIPNFIDRYGPIREILDKWKTEIQMLVLAATLNRNLSEEKQEAIFQFVAPEGGLEGGQTTLLARYIKQIPEGNVEEFLLRCRRFVRLKKTAQERQKMIEFFRTVTRLDGPNNEVEIAVLREAEQVVILGRPD